MKVGIGDIDYFYNKKGFNTDCMKISSYYQQLGHTIFFVTSEYDINRPYDLFYITKKDILAPAPPLSILNASNVKIGGKGFKYYNNGELPDYILACRCDYLLYPEKNTAFERAEMVQFFNNKGRRLKLTQDARNSFKRKRTLVIDQNFWEVDKDLLLEVLQELKNASNLSFLEPILTKKILCDEQIKQKFLQLNFTSGAQLRFKNNLGDDYNSIEKIVNLIQVMKEEKKIKDVSTLICCPITKNHFDRKENAGYDFERCLRIINLGKVNSIKIEFESLESRLSTPYIILFESIINGSQKRPKNSYIEGIALKTAKRYNCNIEDVYRDNTKGDDIMFYEVMVVLNQRRDGLEKYCLRKGGNNFTKISQIDGKNIEENC